MSTAPGAQGFSFWAVISEARRIIRAHNRHFFSLSLLFLFPLCLSSVIYLALYTALSHHDGFYPQQWLLLFPADPTGNRSAQPILLPFLINLFAQFFTLCAWGTITYSTFNGFYGRPLTLASSVKSLLYTFLPLLATQFVFLTIVFCIAMVFGVLGAILITGLQSLGVVEVNYHGLSISFKVLVIIMLVLLLVSMVLWLQVKWCLAYVIVVEESKWGYEALRRSGELVKGMRGVALCVLLYFGILSLSMTYLMMMIMMVGAPNGHWSWTHVFQAVLYIVFEAQLMLHAFAANVVLYIYCKALAEGDLDFGSNYMCLPFHHAHKVSEVV
ncbi:PREDICTED: uncharacterized protein LOC109179740 isoform X2 [Ipomoea nil]|uniref:uncharacterized protein LOC109179740 isoform X1 n=1 Tax=Ipomoea nil TaxID=35883 RepID=UPI000900F09D|nr:PREDICTED: uncharacterized protein LOC109179740 isoform X1 [Ipomoea nil]XP_019184783.1 PREDICTED: uncharacterized protein LOC109179740 isoform X2 [Ipomoea nil]